MSQVDPMGLRKNPRYESHALVEVRTSRWNPFAVESAVLIDISWDGFKVEFVGAVKQIKPKSWTRFSIPLAPFEILHPSVFRITGETRWFDARNSRCGGVFRHANEEEKFLLGKIIDFVAQKRKNRTSIEAGSGDDE